MIWKKWIRSLLELLYPRRACCMGCGDMTGMDRDDLCEACRSRLAKSWVGLRMPDKKLQLDGAAYAYRYAGVGGALVRRLKYSGVDVLAEQMGRDLARAAMLLRLEKDVVVTCVPMHPKRRRTRGRNHSESLARHTAACMGLEYRELIFRTRNTAQQARLENDARRRNLEDAFAAVQRLDGRTVLLVDDVLTTGTTAKCCAEALRAAGAKKVYFAAYTLGGSKQEKQHG